MNVATFPISNLSKKHTLTVSITVTRRFRLRMWLATKLMCLAAVVLGCNIDIVKKAA